MNISAIVFPFLLFFMLASAIFSFFSKKLNRSIQTSLLTALLISPLLIGLFLYALYLIAPGLNSLFYGIALTAFVSFFVVISRNCLPTTWRSTLTLITSFKSDKLNFLGKVLIIAILPIILLVVIRTVFWPPIWDDQVFYIEQAYSIGQSHESRGFFQNIEFRNENLKFETNTSIRPGLPMIYSLSSLFSDSLSVNFLFAKVVVLYFFLLTLAIIFVVASEAAKVNKNETGLVALFFTLTTFYFIDHSISGFKELIIISGILLVLNIGKDLQKSKYIEFILIGALLGLISFINYSGTLITLFILFILLLGLKDKFLIKIYKIILIFIIAIIFSGLEIFALIGLALPNKTEPQKTQTTTGDVSNTNSKSLYDSMSIKGGDEFTGYDINNAKDLYTKGKFQGLFQFQFYGLIFILFWVTFISRFSCYMRNPFSRIALYFLGLYTLIFFDPLNFNHHPLVYVLTISHKYTVLLVPIVATLIALEWSWLSNTINRINIRIVLLFLFGYLVLDILWIRGHYDTVLKLLENVMPIHRNNDYYLNYLRLGDKILLVFALVLLISFTLILLKDKKSNQNSFVKYSVPFLTFLFLLFYLPCFFFFNTNYGLNETFKYTFSNRDTQLSHLKEKYVFSSISQLNSLPHKGKVLVINLSANLIRPYAVVKSDEIVGKAVLKNQNSPTYQDFVDNNIEYIFAANGSLISGAEIETIPFIKPIYQGTGNSIYSLIHVASTAP